MPARTSQLNVSITPHFSKFIRRKIESGRYSSASEVVREALHRLEQAETIGVEHSMIEPKRAPEAVRRAIGSIERGDAIELKDETALREFFDDIVGRGKKRLAVKKRAAGR